MTLLSHVIITRRSPPVLSRWGSRRSERERVKAQGVSSHQCRGLSLPDEDHSAVSRSRDADMPVRVQPRIAERIHACAAPTIVGANGRWKIHDMIARTVDEVDCRSHLVHAGIALAGSTFREAVRGLPVEVRGPVVREHPAPAAVREVIPRLVDGDKGLVGVAVLLVLEAGGLGELHVPRVEGNEREEVELPTGLEDGDGDLGDLRKDVLHTEAESRGPPHRLSDASITFGH